LWSWFVIVAGSIHCFSGGHIHIGRILLCIPIGVTVGVFTALLYVGIVAVLWAWSNYISRTVRTENISAEHIWPPPVNVPYGQDKDVVR
jgi:hypothetical protein